MTRLDQIGIVFLLSTYHVQAILDVESTTENEVSAVVPRRARGGGGGIPVIPGPRGPQGATGAEGPAGAACPVAASEGWAVTNNYTSCGLSAVLFTDPTGVYVGGVSGAPLVLNGGVQILFPSTDQIVFGAFHKLTINSPTIAATAQTYTIPDVGANGNIPIAINGQTKAGVIPIVAANAASNTVLTAAQSGSWVTIPQSTANVTIELPAVAPGLNFRFIFQAIADGSHTTTIQVGSGPSPVLAGYVTNSVGGAINTVTPTLTIVRSADGSNTHVGDWIEARSDGTSFFVNGQGLGVTFKAT
jgi:hypothetical protein